MVEIIPNLFIGDKDDFLFFQSKYFNDDYLILNLIRNTPNKKYKTHQTEVGWTVKGANKNSPYYLYNSSVFNFNRFVKCFFKRAYFS